MRANTVMENGVPMWLKKPNRVPGRSQTVLIFRSVARRSVAGSSTTVPSGAFLTRATASISDRAPRPAAAVKAVVQPGPASRPRNGTAVRTCPNCPDRPVN